MTAPAFVEDFRAVDPQRWTVSASAAPRSSASNRSSFSAEHVFVKDGVLCLELTQTLDPDGTVASVGGEISTVERFGYGTYKFEMKASSTAEDPLVSGSSASGSITGASLMLEQSVTEIDVEVEGLPARHALTQTTTWVHEQQPSETKRRNAVNGFLPHYGFHAYSLTWGPGLVKFYRDGALIATHTRVVPTEPAPFVFNHWGTVDPTWGGAATPDVPRYMFVKSFSFTPLPTVTKEIK